MQIHSNADTGVKSNLSAAEAPRTGVRGRILLIGALATAATAFLVTQAEMVLSSLRIGYLQFPPVALGLLLVAVAVSRGLRRVSARWGLSASDLLVIYIMMLVGAMVSSHGLVQKWIPLLVALPTTSPTSPTTGTGCTRRPPAPLAVPVVHRTARTSRPVARWYYGKMPRGGVRALGAPGSCRCSATVIIDRADRVRLPVPDGHPAAAVGGQREALVPAGPAPPGDRGRRGAAHVLLQPPDVAGRAAADRRVRRQGAASGAAVRARHRAPVEPERLLDDARPGAPSRDTSSSSSPSRPSASSSCSPPTCCSPSGSSSC